MVISAHEKWTCLSQALHFCDSVHTLDLLVQMGSSWVLELSPLSPCLRETLARIPWKILRVQGEKATSSVTDVTLSTLKRCIALNSVVGFDSLHVEARGACGEAAMRTLTLALAGSLRKLVCQAIPMSLEADLNSVLEGLEVVELTACTATGLRAAGQLPGLHKLTCLVCSEEAWPELCKLTQLKELCTHVLCPPRANYTEMYNLRGLTHLRLFVHLDVAKQEEEFRSGLLQNMPQLEDLSLRHRGARPVDFRLAV